MKNAVFAVWLLCAASAVAQDEVVLTQVAAIALPGWSGGCVVDEQIAYVAGGNAGLLIYDVSDPLTPTLIGSRDSLGSVGHVEVRYPYAFVGVGVDSIHIVNISNPTSPVLLSTFTEMNRWANFDVYGVYLYVAQHLGLMIVDVTDPANSVVVSVLPVGQSATAIGVGDGFVAYATFQYGVFVIDVSSPESPFVRSNFHVYDVEAGVSDVDVFGRLAFMTSSGPFGDDLGVADLADLDSPHGLSSVYALWGFGGSIDLGGGYAYWPRMETGIIIVNAFNPQDMYSVGQWLSGDYYSNGPAVSGAHLIDAGFDSLRVLHIRFRARGNVNYDFKIDAADIISLVNYVFRGGPPPQPEAYVGDTDCDALITMSDILRLVAYLFKGGPRPLCD